MDKRRFAGIISIVLAAVIAFQSGLVTLEAFASDGDPSESSRTEEVSSDIPVSESEPEPASSEPEPVSSEPEPISSQPEPASSDPMPSADPEPASKYENGVYLGGQTYITDYQILDYSGRVLTTVRPGDRFIFAVTVYDERVEFKHWFNGKQGQLTGMIHAIMAQGSFTIASADSVNVRIRDGYNEGTLYTIEFRDVTYQGGNPNFTFTSAYVRDPKDNLQVPVPQTTLGINVLQANDDVPAPQIILNSANYGGRVTAGSKFYLSTSAVNTSSNLELDNVSVRIILPTGLSMADGNSQVLIGKVGRSGTINHTFSLQADNSLSTETASLPVTLVYTYEAFVNGGRQQFTSQQDLSVTVAQPIKFEIQSSTIPEEVYLGSYADVSLTLVNKGKTPVYNVTVEVTGDGLRAEEVEFLGNINAGSSADTDVEITGESVGSKYGKVRVTYEDSSGNEYVIEKDFTIEVLEEYKWDEPIIEPVDPQPRKNSNKTLTYVLAAVAAAALIGGAIFLKKRKARKLAAELEDDDEDI